MSGPGHAIRSPHNISTWEQKYRRGDPAGRPTAREPEVSAMSMSTIGPARTGPDPRAAAIGAEPWPRAVTGDLAYLRTILVNVFYSGLPGAGDRDWVLIDAGMPGHAGAIASAAARRFRPGARPSAIIMTHGHFDHVGSLLALAQLWDVPVFAHELELPYLTGRSAYPPPDPTVGGGLLALFSWLFPRGPIDLGARVHPLPADGSVPFMPGWRWIHTPGHTAGHVALFRDSDRTLIAGDAFVTTKQESALAVAQQRQEVHGPPAYYTSDWPSARQSVEALSALNPELAATGHGVPMTGEPLRAGLRALLKDFDTVAYPQHGRYAHQPALADARGVISVPPEPKGISPKLATCVAAGLLAGIALGRLTAGRRR